MLRVQVDPSKVANDVALQRWLMTAPIMIVEELEDPDENARALAQHARAVRNSEWLSAHWSDVLPEARGRHVAVACEAAFIADSAEEAWSKVKAAHPEDDGAILQYVPADCGWRV